MLSSFTSMKWYSASKVALIWPHIFVIYPWVTFLDFINHCNTLTCNVAINSMMKITSLVTFYHVQSFSKMNRCYFVSWVSFLKNQSFCKGSHSLKLLWLPLLVLDVALSICFRIWYCLLVMSSGGYGLIPL